MTAAVDMRGVEKRLGNRSVLNHIDWTVPPGSIYGLIGPNGAGKTTLLRVALGLLRADRGRVFVFGEEPEGDGARLRERVYYVASDDAMVPALRVEEWLRYAGMIYPRWDRARAARLVAGLEIAPRQRIQFLSTGQRTSLQIAVAVAAKPDLLLLDEPTNGLDPVVKTQVIQLLLDVSASEGTTMVLATHHIEDVERLADHLAVLYDGRFLYDGALDDLKAEMHRVQVVFSGEEPPDLDADPRVLTVDRRGKVALVTVQGPADPVIGRLREAGAVVIEPVDLDLAEAFRVMLAKEGYTRAELRSVFE
jgi:ABC-2 type transport system ATP-binding protein